MAEAEPQAMYQVRRPNQWDEEWAYHTSQQLNEINSKCNLIVAEIRKLKPSDQISPELQKAVQDVGVSARKVDRKVPDQKKQPPKRKQSKAVKRKK